VGELQQLLSKTQSDLEKLTLQNQELSTNLSKIQNEQDQLTTRQTSSLQQAKKMSDLESRVKELQQLLTQKQSDLEKNRSESEEISSNLSRVQKERDALQTELATAQQENDQRADNTKNPRSNATLESMQKKNDQLHNSLADIESLYSALRTEKIDIEKSFEVTSNCFKSLLTENESLQKSTRKDLKRVQECNKSLEEALKFISTLIAELKSEIQQANGSPPPISPAKGTESPEVVSNKTSECKLLVQNTETLLEKLMDLKQTKQQLALAIQQLVMDVTVKPDLADDKSGVAVDGGATLLSPMRSNESSDSSINQPSQLSETKESASSTTSSDNNMIQQMLEKAKSTNHLSKSDKQRLVTNLENEMKGDTQQGRDKSASPTNVPLMKRLWRKNSTPHKTGR
jgi:DNA repair exonuclease SbcCD ATPase subunit